MRIVAGLVAGGVFPVAMALIGDLVPINQRQVAIARLLGIALTANVLGASICRRDRRSVRLARRLRDPRHVLAARCRVLAFWAFRNRPIAAEAAVQPRRGDRQLPRHLRRSARQGLLRRGVPRSDLHPRAVSLRRASCCAASARPAPRSPASLIGCFAVGGILYSLAVPYLVAAVPERHLMLIGGAIGGVRPRADRVAFLLADRRSRSLAPSGFGFYLLHSCIQVHVTDLSQTARGAAASLHSSSFYLGQAIGPVVYGFGFAHGGPEPTILFGALVVLGVGVIVLLAIAAPAQSPHEPNAQHRLLPDLQLGVERARHRSGGAADRGRLRDLADHRGAAGGGLRRLRAARSRCSGPMADAFGKSRMMIACLAAAGGVVVSVRRGDRASGCCSCCASWPAPPAAAASRSAWR